MLLTPTLARELAVQERQIEAAVALLDGGATVPFIARYRKEATGGLDDTQLRLLEERLGYLRELEERRGVILASIREQGQLTAELETALLAADTKTRLEDLYLPYKPKRRTKAQIAREAGLAPLAHGLLNDPTQTPEAVAAAFVDAERGVPDVKAALDGARQILMEEFAENAELLAQLREYLWDNAVLHSQMVEGKAEEGAKFRDYFDYREALRQIPSHRALALFRGRNEDVLQLTLEIGDPAAPGPDPGEQRVAARFGIRDEGRPADAWLRETARWAWKVKLLPHLDTELKQRLREAAEEEAIQVFARNLRDLLLAAPAGARPTLGLDPGLRTGVKVAVVDATGKLVDTATIYPHVPRNQWDESLHVLAELCRRHRRRADQHRQRHRLARNRPAGDRADAASSRTAACTSWWCRKRALRSIPPRNWRRGSFPKWMSRCAARCPSPAACKTRWRNWSRSNPRPSASASTSTMSARPGWRGCWMPWSRTASTRSAWT